MHYVTSQHLAGTKAPQYTPGCLCPSALQGWHGPSLHSLLKPVREGNINLHTCIDRLQLHPHPCFLTNRASRLSPQQPPF